MSTRVAWIVPNVEIKTFWGALLTAVVIAVLNAVLPPIVAALRLPFTLVLGFLLVLVLDAAMLLAASSVMENGIEHAAAFVVVLGCAVEPFKNLLGANFLRHGRPSPQRLATGGSP